MPSFLVTNVNTTSEELTAAGHGLVTGDRFRLRGAIPAATPSLAPAVDYFAIRVDNDKIKVAVSSSDALAGTAVNLTAAGTGALYIGYQLPYCVPRIAAPLSQVKSADLNAEWNATVGLFNVRSIPLSWADFTSQRTGIKGKLHATNFDRWIKDTDTTFACECGISGIPAGAIITKIENYFKRGSVASSSANVSLERMAKNGAPGSQTQVGVASDSGTDGTYQTITLTLNHVVLADTVYWIQASQSSQAASNGYEMVGASVYWIPPVL